MRVMRAGIRWSVAAAAQVDSQASSQPAVAPLQSGRTALCRASLASVAPCRHRTSTVPWVGERRRTHRNLRVDLGAIAAIDIGTNSIHTVLARNRRYEVLTREKATVRLSAGSGGGDMDTLDADAIDRGIAALTRAAQGLSSATPSSSPWRPAPCAARPPTPRRSSAGRDEAGVSVEVISGGRGGSVDPPGRSRCVSDRPHALIDIGGGSTEVLYGTGDEVTAAAQRFKAIRPPVDFP